MDSLQSNLDTWQGLRPVEASKTDWQGLQEQSDSQRMAHTAIGVGVAYEAHHLALKYLPNYAERAYDFARIAENRFPGKILKTFGASQLLSRHLPGDIRLTSEQLVKGVYDLSGERHIAFNDMGAHLSRMLGPDFAALPWERQGFAVEFRQEGTSPFRRMYVDGERSAHQVSFIEKGKLSSASALYKAPFVEEPDLVRRPTKGAWAGFQDWFQRRRRLQSSTGGYGETVPLSHAGELLHLQPYLGKTEGRLVQNLSTNIGQRAFVLTERLNSLMAHAGVGIRPRSYNTAHGLVGALLTQRVLPVAVGLTVAGYADYLTGHKVSDAAWGLWAKARIAHAEATDDIPGTRAATDWYDRHVPGPWYGPLAVPLSLAFAGGMVHSARVALGVEFATSKARKYAFRGAAKKGLLIGAALIAPLIPGMLGSRQTANELRAQYSGEEDVEIRSGRWWEMGSTPFRGNRILMRRPHAYVLHKTRAEDIALYGSEEEKWAHNPLISPLTWLKDPYYLENRHAGDRPYPETSPAFSNVPLIGHLLAASIGKIVKPVKRMYSEEWNGEDYTLASPQLEPKGPAALAPLTPKAEFGPADLARRSWNTFTEMIGLPGFFMRSATNKYGPQSNVPDVYYQGSRQMTSLSRRYYERELGAMSGFTPEGEFYGFSEPIRRFIQPEPAGAQANELRNEMPSWLPNGDEYFHDFHKGDPYLIPMGYARLPGAGYAALHPEVEGLMPDEYPDIVKLRILGDVAPWSGKFRQFSAIVKTEAGRDPALEIEYQKIVGDARRMRESTVNFDRRHTGETEEVEGTVAEVSARGLELKEHPGRKFSFSSIGMSAADLSSRVLGEENRSLEEETSEVQARQKKQYEFLTENLAPGTQVRLVVPKGALESEGSAAVVYAGGQNINRGLADLGLAKLDVENAGPEAQEMDGPGGRAFSRYVEGLAFSGDEAWYNPLRYVPKPMHTKLWQERTPRAQYEQQEVYGVRQRRWQKPVHDMITPWLRGMVKRLTGDVIVPAKTHERRDLDTLVDQLEYLRAVSKASQEPEHRGRWAMKAAQTAIGSNLFADSSDYIARTLPGRDRRYYEAFRGETNPEERERIVKVVSPQMADALMAQWTKQRAMAARAEGEQVPGFSDSGRLVSEEDIVRGEEAGVAPGDAQRAAEIAQFFSRRGLRLPSADSPVLDEDIDYEDLKLKIIQWEGLDYHDFNVFDDRAGILWRKPYLDGAVRELTAGEDRSVDQMESDIEGAIAMSKSGDAQASARMNRHATRVDRSNITVTVEAQPDDELRKEVRRNPEDYQ
jgi:hypothetical protein